MRSLFKFDPPSVINMQAGVSNQVERVLEIHERKRTGVLVEIDEKPELSCKQHNRNKLSESSLTV